MRKKVILSIVLFFIVLFFWKICDSLTSFYVTARYKEMKPLPFSVDVLYKGLKIGRVVSSRHSDDFEHTILKLKLHPKTIIIPDNVIAFLKIEKRRFGDYDYIELIKPENPSETRLVSGMSIVGESMIDTKNYFSNQRKDELEEIKDNLYKASESLVTTIDGIGALFSLIQEVISSNESYIKQFTKGLSTGANNISSFTSKLDNATSQERIENSLRAIEGSFNNVEGISSSVKESLPLLIQESTSTVTSIGDIASGVSTSLNKPFGGLRLLFGKSGKGCDIH